MNPDSTISRNEVFNVNALQSLAASAATVALLAWTAPSQAGASYSFSFHGGDHRAGGHFHGHFFDWYGGHRPGHGYWRRHYDRPAWRPHRPYWRHRAYYPYPRRWGPGPRCIYRYHQWYCR